MPPLYPVPTARARRVSVLLAPPRLLPEAVIVPADTTAPVVTIVTGLSGGRISGVTGKDTFSYSFTVDEACQAWKLKMVPGNSSPDTAGTLIESGGAVASGGTVSGDVTYSELTTALGGTVNGTYIIKAFTQDLAGNWSV